MEAQKSEYRNGGPGFRPGSPETSRAAAESMAEAAAARDAKALAFVTNRKGIGATADEVAAGLDWERYSSRPRLSELRKRGAIVDSGDRRKAASGRSQAVWVIPAFGPGQPVDPQGDLLAVLA